MKTNKDYLEDANKLALQIADILLETEDTELLRLLEPFSRKLNEKIRESN